MRTEKIIGRSKITLTPGPVRYGHHTTVIHEEDLDTGREVVQSVRLPRGVRLALDDSYPEGGLDGDIIRN